MTILMQTESGRGWPLLHPEAADVHWPDIAASLSKICRFNGHVKKFYSVAQHSVLVARFLPEELQIYGLLHDAHEAFVGDRTRPMRDAEHALRMEWLDEDHPHPDYLKKLVCRHDQAIYEAADLDWPLAEDKALAIHEADMRLLATERRDLLNESKVQWGWLPEPFPEPIHPWSCEVAEDQWTVNLKDNFDKIAQALPLDYKSGYRHE